MARSPFEKSLHNRFDKREMHPSASAWERIESSLNQKQATTKHRKIWVFLLSGAASIILLMWIGRPERSGLNIMLEHSEAKVEMAENTLDVKETILIDRIEMDRKEYVLDIPVQSQNYVLIQNKIPDQNHKVESIEVEIAHIILEEDSFQKDENSVVMLEEYGIEEIVENKGTSFDENFRDDHNRVAFQIDPAILLASIEGSMDEPFNEILSSPVRSKVSIDPETLLREVEESEIKSFMEKLTETVVSKSGQVITGVLRFADR